MNIAVLGAGAWGTALAIALSSHHRVSLWTRDPAHARMLDVTRENARYLPGYPIPAQVSVSADLRVLADAELRVCAVPMVGLRALLAQLEPESVAPLVLACKGFECGSALLPHEVALDILPQRPIGVLSGPSFAQEVAAGLPAAVVLACAEEALAGKLALAFHSSRLRAYSNTDVVGVEIAGATKNVMAIAAGICDGLGLGLNARAALITRGLAEITRLGLKLGGRAETFMGLAGLGDLILTCTGDLSRNRTVGLKLGQGVPLAGILAGLGHVAEGVGTANEVTRLAERHGVEMPITRAVSAVLRGERTPVNAVAKLLERDQRSEY